MARQQKQAPQRKPRPARKPDRAPGHGASPADESVSIRQVADLAWAGQHARAVEVATAALADAALSSAQKLDLLDLRSESYVALGDLDRAAADAAAMRKLASVSRSPEAKAQAGSRTALIEIRRREPAKAVRTATAALASARAGRRARATATGRI